MAMSVSIIVTLSYSTPGPLRPTNPSTVGLAIAQLPLVATISILGATVVGCVYLTKKDK